MGEDSEDLSVEIPPSYDRHDPNPAYLIAYRTQFLRAVVRVEPAVLRSLRGKCLRTWKRSATFGPAVWRMQWTETKRAAVMRRSTIEYIAWDQSEQAQPIAAEIRDSLYSWAGKWRLGRVMCSSCGTWIENDWILDAALREVARAGNRAKGCWFVAQHDPTFEYRRERLIDIRDEREIKSLLDSIGQDKVDSPQIRNWQQFDWLATWQVKNMSWRQIAIKYKKSGSNADQTVMRACQRLSKIIGLEIRPG